MIEIHFGWMIAFLGIIWVIVFILLESLNPMDANGILSFLLVAFVIFFVWVTLKTFSMDIITFTYPEIWNTTTRG